MSKLSKSNNPAKHAVSVTSPPKNLFAKRLIGYFMEVLFPKNIHFRPKHFHDVFLLLLIQLLTGRSLRKKRVNF